MLLNKAICLLLTMAEEYAIVCILGVNVDNYEDMEISSLF
jgi:hypothetical protein